MAQNKAITFRISETLLARFKRALEKQGIDQTTFLLSKINEFCDEVERHNQNEGGNQMYRAIYITNGGFDAVVVQDGTYLEVTPEVMRHFLAAQNNGDDFSEWHGTNDWPIEQTGEYDDEIWEAAEKLGTIVAFYDADGKLHIVDDELWEKRKEFFGM